MKTAPYVISILHPISVNHEKDALSEALTSPVIESGEEINASKTQKRTKSKRDTNTS